MADQTEKLLGEALKLPTPDRARLAAELIASVDGGAEPEAEAAWAAEIDRRVRKVTPPRKSTLGSPPCSAQSEPSGR